MNVNRAVLYLGCFTIGIIAGLRSLTAAALVSWAAHLGWLDLSDSRQRRDALCAAEIQE